MRRRGASRPRAGHPRPPFGRRRAVRAPCHDYVRAASGVSRRAIDCVMHVFCEPMQGELNDRYEPLPGLAQLPAFIWRRLPRAGKAAVVMAALGAVALAIALSPAIERSKEEHARADAARSARIER